MGKALDLSGLERVLSKLDSLVGKATKESVESLKDELRNELKEYIDQQIGNYRLPECTLEEMRERVRTEETYPQEATIITYATEDE